MRALSACAAALLVACGASSREPSDSAAPTPLRASSLPEVIVGPASSAEPPRPVAARPERPLPAGVVGTFRAAFDVRALRSCSQSHASTHAAGRYALTLEKDGRASLSLEVESTSITGPSRGRFAAGDRDISHWRSVEHQAWKGHATADREGVRVALEMLPAGCSGEGGAPRSRCARPASITLSCKKTEIDVLADKPTLPRVADKGVRAEALLCLGLGDGAAEGRAFPRGLPFGAGAGLGAMSSERPWGELDHTFYRQR